MTSVYRRNTGISPEARAVGRAAGEGVEKSLARQRNAAAIKALQDQAREWRDRSLTIGLDPEVKALLVRKAVAAEAEADRLFNAPETMGHTSAVDEERAQEYDREAKRCERKALDTSINLPLRQYYRDKAREHRDTAAALRGQPIEHEAPQPVNRTVSIVLPH